MVFNAMKGLLLLLLGSLFVSKGISQKFDSATLSKLSPADREEAELHIKKAKGAKTTAWCLLIGGGVVEAVAIALEVNDWSGNGDGSNQALAAVLAFTGAGAMLASVPFFFKARHQRELVRAIVTSDKPVSMGPNLVLPRSASYGIKFVIPIGK